MFYIGPHVSISTSLALAPERAEGYGATGFGMFTKNQRQWSAKPLTEAETTAFKTSLEGHGYKAEAVLPHDSYLINLGSPDEEKRQKSLNAFIDELERCRALGLRYLNFHPGSHLGAISEDECLSIIAGCLDKALDEVSGVMPVLEITAGAGSNLGFTIEQLATIISRCDHKDEVGICIDTCHAFQAGYDISSPRKAEEFFDQVEQLLPGKLKGLHLNDAKAPCGRHLDRHESLGRGEIGLDTFLYIASDSRFENIPMVLETPDESLWPAEVRTLLEVSR